MHRVDSSSMAEANNNLIRGKRSSFSLDDFKNMVGK